MWQLSHETTARHNSKVMDCNNEVRKPPTVNSALTDRIPLENCLVVRLRDLTCEEYTSYATESYPFGRL